MKDVLKLIKDIVSVELIKVKEKEYKAIIESERVYKVLSKLKYNGFEHLTLISAVDWIDKNRFELVYILWSYKYKIELLIKTYINREEPKFETIKELWPIASTYEREIYEMFGIEFIGNEDRRPFILEGWKGKPPMRKDFILVKYANKKFKRRNYEKEF